MVAAVDLLVRQDVNMVFESHQKRVGHIEAYDQAKRLLCVYAHFAHALDSTPVIAYA